MMNRPINEEIRIMSRYANFHRGVKASFECKWVELPDNDLTRATYVLAPSFFFGDAFQVESVGDAAVVAPTFPHTSTVTATMSKALYTLMIRFQQGAETSGDDPPPWALVENSATDLQTGRILGTGEVFPMFP
jgi:hypothetical protein